jgi:hypothetical protein
MGTTLASGQGDTAQAGSRKRAELAAILASDTFKRSPKLSRLLLYLCEKSLQGLAGQITEYGIGIDVLGRDPDFDPQQDALVRVDTHHLRKRLKEYYANTGSEHEIHIILRNGSYAPEFVYVGQSALPAPAVPPLAEPTKPLPYVSAPDWSREDQAATADADANSRRRKLRWIVAGMAVLMALSGWGLVSAGRQRTVPALPAPLPGGSIAVAQDPAIRVAAGDRSADYTDHLGRVWMSDRFFRGGSSFRRGPLQIQRTLDGELFRNGREGQFVYDIPLNPGTYELHLYFAETGVATESLRGVSMAINSVPFPTVDVACDAGGINTATVKIFKNISPAKDGLLHLTFLGTGPSFLNAFEILPGIPGKMRPVRLTARESIYRDKQGQIWMPDESSAGGRRSTTTAQIEGTADPGLYQTDRVGHFTYSIPVAEGSRYTVRLHFAESWFSQADPSGGIGSRVFDVYCNGTTLLKNFDILKEAGGGKRAIFREFRGIQASPQGKIDLTFTPVANYALVNAIEVIEE